MRITSRTKTIAFFITLGACLTAAWRSSSTSPGSCSHSREQSFRSSSALFSSRLIIAGLVVYTVFLVREIHRTSSQDSFLNAVTHELKTPIASIRLYLETLQTRPIDEAQRQRFLSHHAGGYRPLARHRRAGSAKPAKRAT